jgi:hypothetical protein
MWEPLIESVSRHLILVLIAGVFTVQVLANGLVQLVRAIGRERTRREIAAYVADGNMTPEQGERLLVAKER